MINKRRMQTSVLCGLFAVLANQPAQAAFEDFETTPDGSLPAGWITVAGSPAVESGITADDGSSTNALVLRPVGTSAVAVLGGPSDAFGLAVDVTVHPLGQAFIQFRGPDLDEG